MEGPVTYQFKIILVGDISVGKSNLLSRFCRNEFSLEPKVTVGFEFATKVVKADQDQITIQVWDTCGQEHFSSVTSSFYKGSIGAFIIFDISNSSTFKSLDKWYNEVKDNVEENAIILLVGNKTDLNNLREVRYEDAQAFAQKRDLVYFETSALASTNVNEAFIYLITEAYQLFQKYGAYHDPNESRKLSKRSLKLKANIEKKGGCC